MRQLVDNICGDTGWVGVELFIGLFRGYLGRIGDRANGGCVGVVGRCRSLLTVVAVGSGGGGGGG